MIDIMHRPPLMPILSGVAAEMAERPERPDDEEFVRLLGQILVYNSERSVRAKVAQALMVAQAASGEGLPNCVALRAQLLVATRCPLDDNFNFDDELCNANLANLPQSLLLAAFLMALSAPREGRSYALEAQADSCLKNFGKWLASYPELKLLLSLLRDAQKLSPRAFTPVWLDRLAGLGQGEGRLDAARARAKSLAEGQPNINARISGMPEMLKGLFAVGSDLRDCLGFAADDDRKSLDIVKEILKSYSKASGPNWVLDDKKIEDAIDRHWFAATRKKATKRLNLGNAARCQIKNAIVDRLETIWAWTEAASDEGEANVAGLLQLRKDILGALNSLPANYLRRKYRVPYSAVVAYAIDSVRRKIERHDGPDYQLPLFAEALRTGMVALDDRFMPVLSHDRATAPYYEPWRRALRHVAGRKLLFGQMKARITTDEGSDCYGNLMQLRLICRLWGEELEFDEQTSRDAEAKALALVKETKGTLELTCAIGGLTDQESEDLLWLVDAHWNDFRQTGDFGCCRQFLKAVARKANELEGDCAQRLREEIDARLRSTDVGDDAKQVLAQARRELDDGQYALAEEDLAAADSGEALPLAASDLEADDHFSRFVSPEFFGTVFRYCERELNGRALHSLEARDIETLAAKLGLGKRTSHHWVEAASLLQNWPNGGRDQASVQNFIQLLGIDSRHIVPQRDGAKPYAFDLTVQAKSRGDLAFPHPLPSFGTEMKSPLVALVLLGGHTPEEIVGAVTQLYLGEQSRVIVFLDHYMSLKERRDLARLCHNQPELPNFTVIDRVLAIYLALVAPTSRLAALLGCALPFAPLLQPFIANDSRVADEMFCGRLEELNDIINQKGACLVYGGRQLGKTALLLRARSCCHKPTSGNFAVYCVIKDAASEGDVCVRIVGEIGQTLGMEGLGFDQCATLRELCDQVRLLGRQGIVQSFRLFLDEADKFLESIAPSGYKTLQPLFELRNGTDTDFKFVIAGLNDVCRAHGAMANNGLLGQVGLSRCVKPLARGVALRLIMKPLHYLGFRPAPDRKLEALLSITNYYPGLVQLLGYKLVESIRRDFAGFYRAGDDAPPFTLSGDQLARLMNDAGLKEAIKTKFRLSLALDERYMMLARCLGMLYLSLETPQEGNKGYSIDQFRATANEYHIACLTELSDKRMGDFLNEMTEMCVLRRVADDQYLLRKRSFLPFIGRGFEELDAEITRAVNSGDAL